MSGGTAAGGKDSLTRSIAAYSASKIIAQLLGIVGAFVRPKLLSPELYGLWNILNVALRYASYAHGGSTVALRYFVPLHESKKEEEKSRDLKASVFVGTFFIYAVASTALLLAALLKTGLAANARVGLAVMGVIVFLSWQQEYLGSLFKAYQDFVVLGKAKVLHVTLSLALSIPLMLAMNIYGLYISAFLSHVVIVLYLRSKRTFEYGRDFSAATFFGTLKKGFPIMLYDFNGELLRTIDRVIVVSFLGTKQLGYYGVAAMIFAFLRQIPGAAREVLEPKMMQSLSGRGKRDILTEYLFQPLVNNAYYMTIIVGAAVLLMPAAIGLVLPRYLPGIFPAQILALGGYFLTLAYLTRGVVVAEGWQLRVLPLMIATVGIETLVSIAFLKSGAGLAGVAIGGGVAYACMFTGMMYFFSVMFRSEGLPWARLFTRIVIPYPVMLAVLALLLKASAMAAMHEVVEAVLATICYCGIMLCFIVLARTREPLLVVPSIFSRPRG